MSDCDFTNPRIDAVTFTQPADGYDESGHDAQLLYVEFHDGDYAVLKTPTQWHCTPTTLRNLADYIEKNLKEL